MRRALATLAALAALVALVALAREGGSPTAAPSPRPAASPARLESPGTTPRDPASLRDVFRFTDAEAGAPESRPSLRPEPPGLEPATGDRGPRLVGLVRRGGRVWAAFAVDGEVVLAGPGETVGGVTVLSVAEDGVRVRREDGGEETIPLG